MPKLVQKKVNAKSTQSTVKPLVRSAVKRALKTEIKVTTPTPTPKLHKSTKTNITIPTPSKAPNKQAMVIALLAKSEGGTLAELMNVTGWQAHSVRGFLSGTIKKKLGHHLISQKQDGVQIYRIGSDAQ